MYIEHVRLVVQRRPLLQSITIESFVTVTVNKFLKGAIRKSKWPRIYIEKITKIKQLNVIRYGCHKIKMDF